VTVPAVCGAFLLAVLWFDLMFDVQALGAPPGVLPEEVLASIAAYYRRVTTDAAPMGHLVAAVMVVGLVATGARIVRDPAGRPVNALSFLLFAAPVLLALLRVVPNARALATRTEPAAAQSALARGILRDHLLCFASMAAFLALELATR